MPRGRDYVPGLDVSLRTLTDIWADLSIQTSLTSGTDRSTIAHAQDAIQRAIEALPGGSEYFWSNEGHSAAIRRRQAVHKASR